MSRPASELRSAGGPARGELHAVCPPPRHRDHHEEQHNITTTMTDRSERRRSPGSNTRDSKNDSSHSRLTSLLPSTGGGLVKPSSRSDEQKHQQPQGSLLGLDRLAAQKRQTQQPTAQRQYRRAQDETPSHPGGVNREAQNRAKDRERRHRQQRYHPYGDERQRNDREKDRDSRDYRGRGSDRDGNYREGGSDQRDYRDGRNERGPSERDYRRQDDYYARREGGNDSYRSRDRRQGSSMPPPSHVTPSTQSSRPSEHSSSRSFSSARTSQWRGGEDASIDAPTPRRDSSARRDVSDRTPARRRNDATSSWDIETPLSVRHDVDSKLKRPPSDDSEFERHFYLAEDEGHYVQDQAGTEVDGDMGRFLFNNEKTRAREAEMEKKRQENPLSGRFSARKSALQDDQHAWEENRLLSSGAAVKGEVSLDIRTGTSA